MTRFKFLILLLLITGCGSYAVAQDSVVGLLKNNRQQAERYFELGQYEKALDHFKLISRQRIDYDTQLKIARCLFFLKEYKAARSAYAKLHATTSLPMPDLLYYAQLNASTSNYSAAIENYHSILQQQPGDAQILQQIWQLTNVHLLYEDSLHYTIRRLPVNTREADLAPFPHGGGIVFLSDRKNIDFTNPDKESSGSRFTLYYAERIGDSAATRFKSPVEFANELHKASNMGPISFYNGGKNCVFAAPGDQSSSKGMHKMQLFFSEFSNGKWSSPEEFYHNNKDYNFTEPTISADGAMLYFVSDAPGGFGLTDIYRCELKDGRWTNPENLGDRINTAHNESFPFLQSSTLYFSSDGHPGLGGLDVFSTIIAKNLNHEIENMGHPINSGADDFGFVLQGGSRGYFTSNRKNGGYDDDLYEFEMDFRTYPFDIAGVIKMRESNADSLNSFVLANAKIELIDYARNQMIMETRTDDDGRFSVSLPWFSKYVLKIFDRESREYIVSIEIDRESGANANYDIVVVKQGFIGINKTD